MPFYRDWLLIPIVGIVYALDQLTKLWVEEELCHSRSIPAEGPFQLTCSFNTGTSVTLTGTGFLNNAAGTNTVTVDGAAATNVVVVDDTTITCDTPAGPAGTAVDVVVANANGSATLAGGFGYHLEPTLTATAPAVGTSLGGTNVTLSGTGFSVNDPGTNTVSFDGVAATNVVVVNDTTITCDTPAGPAGVAVDVVLANANGTATLSLVATESSCACAAS